MSSSRHAFLALMIRLQAPARVAGPPEPLESISLPSYRQFPAPSKPGPQARCYVAAGRRSGVREGNGTGGWSAAMTTVASGRTLSVTSGQTSTGVIVNSGGTLDVLVGGRVAVLSTTVPSMSRRQGVAAMVDAAAAGVQPASTV